MRTFKLDRHEDLSGNSGTGIVAEGAEFSDGTVALRWLTDSPTSTFYNSMDDVMKLHHHDGATEVIFDDEEDQSSKEGVSMNLTDELKKLADDLKKLSIDYDWYISEIARIKKEYAESDDHFDLETIVQDMAAANGLSPVETEDLFEEASKKLAGELESVSKTPVLDMHVKDGTIWWDAEGKEYVGKADDGTEVGFGEAEDAERYLKHSPLPAMW